MQWLQLQGYKERYFGSIAVVSCINYRLPCQLVEKLNVLSYLFYYRNVITIPLYCVLFVGCVERKSELEDERSTQTRKRDNP